MDRSWLFVIGVGVSCISLAANLPVETHADRRIGTATNMREYETALASVLAESSRPRDRALSPQIYDPAFDVRIPPDQRRRESMRRDAAQAAPNDFLLQWLWAIDWPRASDCVPQSSCMRRMSAAARLQPDNAAAWLPVLDAAIESHDGTAADETLRHMAAANRYEEPAGQLVKAWLDVLKRFPPPKTIDMRDMQFSTSILFAFNAIMSAETPTTVPDYRGIFQVCSRRKTTGVAQNLAACRSLARLMLRGNTMLARNEGRDLLNSLGQPTPDDLAVLRPFLWQLEQSQHLDRSEGNEDKNERQLMADWAASEDELEVLQRRMLRAHMAFDPPRDWQPKSYGN